MLDSAVARVRAFFVLAFVSAFAVHLVAMPATAAGALAIGKCGAYGQAFDYPAEQGARNAALKQCKGDCSAVTMKRACVALSLDMTRPCGAHGYAVAPRISSALNEAMKKCYAFGGKECVIRAWACDARG
ncbi:DUF4189 domain-containing protein [soil metagenome]